MWFAVTDNLLAGPLENRHRELGASFAEFGGWLMPVSYAGTVAEHTATRTTVGLFDVSHLGKALVQGPGAAEFVNSAFTNDLRRIGPGQAQYTLCCTEDGGVIDDLIACGYNALHPCEPSAVDIAALKRQYGGRLCLCGNINLDSTLTLGTPDQVREEVKLRIGTIGPGGGYCCGSSNSVTEYVPFANYLAMLEATREFGRYPLG